MEPGFLTTPEGGISMRLRLSSWTTITERCRPGVQRIIIQRASARRGINIFKIKEKLELPPEIVLSCPLCRIGSEPITGWEILLDQRGSKTRFGTAAAKGAA
jgi:hypothetical protein